MSKERQIVGNYHFPSNPDKHPNGSTGNQQIWEKGSQVGSLEYFPDANEGIRISVYNTKGDKVTDL